MRPSDWIALGWLLDWSAGCVAVALLIAGIVIEVKERRTPP